MPERDKNLKTRLEQCSTALRSSEARFRSIIARSADGILIVDGGGTIRFANPAAESLLGRKADELTGEVFGFPVVAGETSELTIVSRKDEQSTIEMRVVETEWGGEQAFVANLRDITKQKKTVEALRKSEERYSALVHASSQSLYRMSPDWSEIRQLQGGLFIKDTPKPNRNWLQEYIPPDDQKQVLEVIDRAVSTGTIFELEHRVRLVDGTVGWTFSRAIPVRNADGDIVEWFGAASDITERKRNEDEIKRLNMELASRAAELETANRDLEAFNYTVAHDLRKPLTVINGYCQVLTELCGHMLDQECNGYIREAYDGTGRMNRLIDDLLNFSKAGHAEPKRKQVNLSSLADEVMSELKRAEPERRVSFRMPGEIPADADPDLLRIVLSNLLGNSWKYTVNREEGIIEFGTAEIDGTQAYFVRDNGVGFNPTNEDTMFAPFRRLETGKEIGGLGIGLATVARIIRRHSGKVWVEGEPDKGACFYFTLSAD